MFEPQYLLGGETGVRGVPMGRYAGMAKIISQHGDPRHAVPAVHAARPAPSLRDDPVLRRRPGLERLPRHRGRPTATTLALKYGVGGGVFLQWGEAAIFRVEAAYSPDAESENPGFPVGIYVSDGLMF